MTSKKRPESLTRINTRLEAFLAQQLGYENVEFYEQESCIQDDKKKLFLQKFTYRILIVCSDRIYLTDNPPKNLDNFICFDDILDIYSVDDVPKFLSGIEKENAFHICIKYYDNPTRKKELERIKRKILELKKKIVYSNAIENKLVEIELNTPRTFRSTNSGNMTENDLSSFRSFNFLDSFNIRNRDLTFNENDDANNTLLTNRSDMLTNRTNKSVRFDNDEPKSKKNENNLDNLDYLTDKAVNERYKGLVEIVNRTKIANNDMQDSLLLNLSLPLTPRSIEGFPLNDDTIETNRSNITSISKQTSKSLETVYDKINMDFIKDCDKKENTLDIYILNPKTRIFQTLKTAHFYSKINSTLNFHNSSEEDTKKLLEQKIKKNSVLEKKFKQLKEEIFKSVDDLDSILNLYDELLKATNDFSFIKKLFWNASDLYKFTVNQINRYLPLSPANMKKGVNSAIRRIKELDCSIALVESMSVMLHETEFFGNRNEILNEEKCKYLNNLIKSLICDPEIAVLQGSDVDQEKYELKAKMDNLILDLNLVSSVLLWEILHFLSSNSWNSVDFNLETLVKSIESSEFLEIFVSRLIGELSKLINDHSNILLTAQETVIVYKVFSFLTIVVEKSHTKVLKNILRQNYQEEFKYYFNEDRMKLKSFQYYPIVVDLLATIKKLEKIVL